MPVFFPNFTVGVIQHNFIDLKGGYPSNSEDLEILKRPGINGFDARCNGRMGKASTIQFEKDYKDGAEMAAELALFQSYVGSLCSLTLVSGDTIADQLITNFLPDKPTILGSMAGGVSFANTGNPGTLWLTGKFEMIDTRTE